MVTKLKSYLNAALAVLFSLFLLVNNASSKTITVQKLNFSPVIDGIYDEWSGIAMNKIVLHKNHSSAITAVSSVMLKAGTFKDAVYFYFEWEDDDENLIHKPWVWDKVLNKYRRGPQREDRLSVQFVIEGNYEADWLSGNEFKADMWHWKSSRSNPLGLAHDKVTVVSTSKILKSYKILGHTGKPIYIFRKSDSGSKLYSTKRYRIYDKDIMPTYILSDKATGSVADVKAKGVWHNGKWKLELKRNLDTGHDDDARFILGKTIKGAIAIFDSSDSDDHTVSDTLLFQF